MNNKKMTKTDKFFLFLKWLTVFVLLWRAYDEFWNNQNLMGALFFAFFAALMTRFTVDDGFVLELPESEENIPEFISVDFIESDGKLTMVATDGSVIANAFDISVEMESDEKNVAVISAKFTCKAKKTITINE